MTCSSESADSRWARSERLAAAYAASLRELIAHGRAAGTAYTPGDFTYADLEADDLANLLAELDEA